MSGPREPFSLIVLIVIFLSALWAILLEVIFLTPGGIAQHLKDWQSLIAATGASLIAICAAYIAYSNTTATLKQARDLKAQERSRKHAAVRAVLPLALAQVTEYAERSAHALRDVLGSGQGGSLPGPRAVPKEIVTPLPSETLKTLTDFIEYSDPPLDVGILQSTISMIQIHNARLRKFVRDDRQLISVINVPVRTELEARIVDAASIYAGAAAMFAYARRQHDELPSSLSWDAVRRALRNMGMWEDNYPSIESLLEARERASAGPLEFLKVNQDASLS